MTEKPKPIAYAVGEQGDKVTVCYDCNDSESAGVIRNTPSFGETVPYPECWVCGQVARPENLSNFEETVEL